MGKSLEPGRGKRGATAPNTVERKAATEEARQILRASLPPATLEEMTPPEPLLWSTRLPGWEEAAQSAIEALYTYAAETKFWRSQALAKNHQHRAEMLARLDLELRFRPPSEILQELSASVGADGQAEAEYRVLRQTSRLAKGIKPLPLLVNLTQQRTEEHGSSAASDEEVAIISAMQGKSSPARRMLIWGWTGAGLWLATDRAIHIWFAVCRRNKPGFRELSAPSAATVRVWRSELKLRSYQGKGRLAFDRSGLPQADAILRMESEAALLDPGKNYAT